jgi:hypothetical protein
MCGPLECRFRISATSPNVAPPVVALKKDKRRNFCLFKKEYY